MLDIVSVIATIVVFILAFAYARGCDHLKGARA